MNTFVIHYQDKAGNPKTKSVEAPTETLAVRKFKKNTKTHWRITKIDNATQIDACYDAACACLPEIQAASKVDEVESRHDGDGPSVKLDGVRVGRKVVYYTHDEGHLKIGVRDTPKPAGEVFGAMPKGESRKLRKQLRAAGLAHLSGAARATSCN